MTLIGRRFSEHNNGSEMALKPDHLAEPAFVGRAAEISELKACLDSVIEGNGRTVFLSGEAGTGKTRLINEFLKIAQEKEITTMVGWCLSNSSIPYFPFIEVFKDHINGKVDATKTLLPKTKHQLRTAAKALDKKVQSEEGNQLRKVSPKVWKDLTFASVGTALQALSELRPILLFIDDLQWADSASLALLHYISRVLATEKVLIVATFRSEEIHPNPNGQANPLVETMRLMRREDLLKEIKIANLSKPDVVKVAENMAGGSLDPEFVMRLAIESQGNPLFVVESMRMLLENRHLIEKKGYFRLTTPELGIPAKVKDIILRRLESLKPDQRRMLDLASVVGEKIDPVLLGAVVSTETLKVLETLNDISVSTSLVYSDESYYRFDHAKSREVLYGEIPSALRREYHSIIAETLEKTAKSPKEVPVNELAYHYAQTYKAEKALQYAISAGEEALSKFCNEEATNYFTYALQTAHDKLQYLNERNKALEGLGDALLAKGMYEKAGKTFEKLAESENLIIRLRALRKGMATSQWLGDLNHAIELAKKAEKYAHVDRLEYARLLVWRGRVVGFSGDPESAIRDLEYALRVFEEEYSLSDAAQALTEAAVYYATEGKMKKALAATRRACALYEDLKDLRGQMDTHMFEGIVFFSCGLHQEALENFDKSTKIAEKLIAYNEFTMTALYASLLIETAGNLNEALSISLGALKYSEKTDSAFLQLNNYQMLTRQYAKLGDLKHAEEFHTKLMKLFTMISQKGTKLAHASAVYTNAVFFSVKEQWDQANSLFEESLQLLKTAVFATLFEPIIKADYATCLAKQGLLNEAQKLSGESRKLREALESQLETEEIHAYLMAKKEQTVGEQLEVRLDIINISKNTAQLSRIESLIPSSFDIELLPLHCIHEGDSIDLAEKMLSPFEVETIKLILYPRNAGIFNLTPSLYYTKNNAKENPSCAIDPVKIIINLKTTPEHSAKTITSNMLLEFEFKTDAAKKAFNFLLRAFVQDYMRRRLPLEWSGWRTLMEIIKEAHVSKYSVYGNGNSRGRAITELENRGLVEVRIFLKERGRGGKIEKVRVFYDKETVKRRIDQEVSCA